MKTICVYSLKHSSTHYSTGQDAKHALNAVMKTTQNKSVDSVAQHACSQRCHLPGLSEFAALVF